jgi:hypothetical protein
MKFCSAPSLHDTLLQAGDDSISFCSIHVGTHGYMLLSSFSCCSALPGEKTQMLQGGQCRMFACLAAGKHAAEAAAAVPAAAAVLPRQPRPVLRRQLQLPAAAVDVAT